MRSFVFIFFFAAFLFILGGCCSLCYKGRQHPVATSVLDSVVITRLTPHPIIPDTARVNALLECDSRGRIYMRMLNVYTTENMKLKFAVDSLGSLLFSANTKPDTVYTKSDSIFINRDIVKYVEVEVPAKLGFIDNIFLKLGYVFIGLFAIILIIFVIRILLTRK